MGKLTDKEKIYLLENGVRCPREEFIAWEQGILLDRRGQYCVVVNELKCKEVDDALEKNLPVIFTKDDKPITYVVDGEEHRWPKSEEAKEQAKPVRKKKEKKV